MKLNKEKLNKDIDDVSKDWDISGGFIVMKDGEILHQNTYGYADRENNLVTEKTSRYVLSTESHLFTGLCILMLLDQGKIKLTDKLNKYIPEYQHANLITIKNLIKSQTGIPDFFYEKIMIDFNADVTHQAREQYDKLRIENRAFNENRSFQKVMQSIGDMPLDYVPGTQDLSSSESNTAFLAEVVRRVSNMSLFDFQKHYIFDPLEMNDIREGAQADTVSYSVFREKSLVRLPLNYAVEGLFTVTLSDMVKLTAALGTGALLSKKMWQQALKLDAEGVGLIFDNANGYNCGNAAFMGYGYFVYFNHETGIAFASLVNEEQKFRLERGVWYYFRRASREVVEATFTYPVDTKMVKLSKTNLWDALNLSVEDDQYEYVLEAKSSVAMALMYKTKKAFVEMEGNRVVGLLVLDINKKNEHYNIDIVLIDKRYQNRGYGKIMLKWAVEYLAKEGAKTLEIGVNRFNDGAINIYKAVGFTEKSIYEESMTLHMKL